MQPDPIWTGPGTHLVANTDEWPAFKKFLTQENEIAIETSDPPLPLSHFLWDPRPFSILPFAFHASLLQRAG